MKNFLCRRICSLIITTLFFEVTGLFAADSVAASSPQTVPAVTDAGFKADSGLERKAAEWVASLQLNNAAKEARVTEAIATQLEAVRNWHNSHSYTDVPAGINPATGKPLSVLDRQIIIDSTIPKSVHENLMTVLRNNLSEGQVAAILDKYTVGKVAFTMRGYEAIVPNLTDEEKTNILKFLTQAREQAIDFKNMKEISAIFKIYKTRCEEYLNSNGRNWHELYKAFYEKIQAQKAAAAARKAKAQ
jgi:Protein of unknown function (DUF3826)